jgi:Ca-activated chloride channel family protein
MIFAHPIYFLLLLLLIPMIGWYIWKLRKSQASIQISSIEGFSKAPNTLRTYLRHVPFLLRIGAFVFLVIALARPQTTNKWSTSSTEGIDIVLVIDVSTSMLAMDLKPDRLEAAKEVAASFINGRPTDNIGLVIFAGESFTQCPMTTDHAVLLNLLKEVKTGMIEDMTAIGHGIATAVSRLKDSKAKSKVIILLTDGTNNRGEIAPLTAAEIAKTFGIRVYTIAVGTIGEAPYPQQTAMGPRTVMMKVEIADKVFTQIAQITGGLYFRATNNAALREIYKEIDEMEKTKMQVQEYSKKYEEYAFYAMIGLLLFLMELLLRYTLLKNIP